MTIERKAWYIAVKELVPFLPVINTQAAAAATTTTTTTTTTT